MELLGLGEILNGLHELSFAEDGGGFGGGERGLLLLELSLVSVGFNLNQQRALLDGLPFDYGDGDDFTGDFGRNFHFRLGLDFTRGGDELGDGLDHSFFDGDHLAYIGFFIFKISRGAEASDEQEGADDDVFRLGFFDGSRRGSGDVHGIFSCVRLKNEKIDDY